MRIQHRLRFFFLWSVNASQVRVRIKCGFKILRVDLTILIQNMRIDFCNHVHLGVAGVTLCRFQISVIQLQLVSRAAVSEGMKNNIGKVGFFLEPSEGVIDDGFLTRTAIRQSNDTAIVQIPRRTLPCFFHRCPSCSVTAKWFFSYRISPSRCMRDSSLLSALRSTFR